MCVWQKGLLSNITSTVATDKALYSISQIGVAIMLPFLLIGDVSEVPKSKQKLIGGLAIIFISKPELNHKIQYNQEYWICYITKQMFEPI